MPASASELDLAALQGTWEQVAFEEDGNPDAPDSYGGSVGSLTSFRGNHFSVRARSGLLLLEGTFALDASRTPKTIDWTDSIGADAGKTLAAIYMLEEDRFTFIAAEPGAPRPGAFKTVTGQTMRSFIRRSGN
ncbi:MAG TPA: TIGR03067 domain-containing protein [Rhizomicrobium sp.]|nr:TIGR03067 domain-containing protein [Rhizomicrobium sp.]